MIDVTACCRISLLYSNMIVGLCPFAKRDSKMSANKSGPLFQLSGEGLSSQ